MNGWREAPIGSLCSGIYDGPHATPKKTAGGPVFLGISSLNNGRLDLAASEHLSEEDFSSWTRRVTPQPGDVVFSYETRLGEAALIPEGLRCCLGRRMALMRPNPKVVDSRFLLYAYLGPYFQEVIRSRTIHGSTVDRIPLIDFPNFPVRAPELPEQRAIAHILGTLDDKIDLNRRMNQTLEEIARALFTSWFVDFDPVRAKAAGRQPAGMDAATAVLFPDGFEGSELGEIPKGWQVQSLDEVARYLNGLALQKYPPQKDAWLPVIKIAQLRSGSIVGADRASASLSPEYVVEDGDMLFSWSGSLEVVLWCGGRGALNQHLFKVTSTETPKWFYYLWTRHYLDRFREIAAGKATTMGHIQRRHLSEAKVLVPSRSLLGTMSSIMIPLVDSLTANGIQGRSLARLRDSLLPRLLSGELPVPVAAAQAREGQGATAS